MYFFFNFRNLRKTRVTNETSSRCVKKIWRVKSLIQKVDHSLSHIPGYYYMKFIRTEIYVNLLRLPILVHVFFILILQLNSVGTSFDFESGCPIL